MARAVAPFVKRGNSKYALPCSTNMSPVKKCSLLKRAPGSMICAHTNNNTTQTVIRMKMPFKINQNRLSCSIALNSIGWKERGWEKDQIGKTLLTFNSRNILVMLRLIKEHWIRPPIHINMNFEIATTRGGGSPKAWKHKMAVHWEWKYLILGRNSKQSERRREWNFGKQTES